MGIQSTQKVSLESAKSRITEIAQIIVDKDYRELESAAMEHDISPTRMIDDEEEQQLAQRILDADLNKWTDTMITDVMDKPFYRHSIFDNYLIEDDFEE